MNKELIFDIDGTLWNACNTTATGVNRALKIMGLPNRITGKDVEGQAGRPNEECIDNLFPGLRRLYPDIEKITDEQELICIKEFGGIFYDGVIKGIKELSKNYKLYLISNCQDWYLDLFLEKSGLRKFFLDVDCNGISNRPKTEMISIMVKNNNMKNPVYIGDTSGDEKSAEQSGVEFNFVSYGFGLAVNRQLTFDTFSEILNYYIEEIPN